MVSRKMKKHSRRRHMRKSCRTRARGGMFTFTKQGAMDKIIANRTAPNIHMTDEDGDLHPQDKVAKESREKENKKLMAKFGITDDDIQKEMREREEKRDRERDAQDREDYDRGTYGGKRRKSRKSRKSRKCRKSRKMKRR